MSEMIVFPELEELHRRFAMQEQMRDFMEFLDYQIPFYLSQSKLHAAQGGNRSGKTLVAALKMYDICMHRHPEIKINGPVAARAIGLKFRENVKGVILRKFKEIVSRKDLLGGSWRTAFNGEMMLLTFENGSTIQFLSDEQDVDAHKGEKLHIVWIDEQGSEEIYDENVSRIIDFDGFIMYTLTPEKGATWLHDKYLQYARLGTDIEFFIFNTLENPYLKNRVKLIKSYARFDDKKRRIKLFGEAVRMSGLVYPELSNMHVIDSFKIDDPKEWNLYIGVDIGLNNPTAVVFWLINSENEIFQTFELYRSGWSVQETAEETEKVIKERFKGIYIPYIAIDARSAKRRNEGYKEKKTNLQLWKETFGIKTNYKMSNRKDGSVKDRIMAMRVLLLPNAEVSWARYRITRNCLHTLREFQVYSYGPDSENKNNPEKPLDKDNHAMTACEFLAETNIKFRRPILQSSNSWKKVLNLKPTHKRGGVF